MLRKLFPSKEMRRYRKMHRKHRRELVELAKRTYDYDWCFLHEYVIMRVKHMHEYYTSGDNVWQSDETRLSIIEELNHVLELQKELEQVEDDDCGINVLFEDGKVTVSPSDDTKERIIEQADRINELYEEIYGYIGKNIRNWWD